MSYEVLFYFSVYVMYFNDNKYLSLLPLYKILKKEIKIIFLVNDLALVSSQPSLKWVEELS